jgi:hypothetical protein
MNNDYRLLNIVASQLLIKVKILLTPLRSVPRCALLLSVVGSFNSDYPENPLQEFSQIGYANFG